MIMIIITFIIITVIVTISMGLPQTTTKANSIAGLQRTGRALTPTTSLCPTAARTEHQEGPLMSLPPPPSPAGPSPGHKGSQPGSPITKETANRPGRHAKSRPTPALHVRAARVTGHPEAAEGRLVQPLSVGWPVLAGCPGMAA